MKQIELPDKIIRNNASRFAYLICETGCMNESEIAQKAETWFTMTLLSCLRDRVGVLQTEQYKINSKARITEKTKEMTLRLREITAEILDVERVNIFMKRESILNEAKEIMREKLGAEETLNIITQAEKNFNRKLSCIK